MKDEQRRWHSYEIEALVFARGLRAFKHFLGDEVKCITDCRALSYIVQKKRYPRKKERSWRDTYQLNISRPREKLGVVDALAKDERWKEEEQRYLESKVLEGRVTVELGSGQQLQFTMSGMSFLSHPPQFCLILMTPPSIFFPLSLLTWSLTCSWCTYGITLTQLNINKLLLEEMMLNNTGVR
jgi:hypothetical protein